MEQPALRTLLDRLDRERAEADRLYNEALTAVDRALVGLPQFPAPPAAYDEQQIKAINESWNILPDGAPAIDRSPKGRLRGFIWRLVGPALDRQNGFNAALVDHLNRNVASHREVAVAIAALLSLQRDHLQHVAQLQSLAIQYLQTITAYVDTRDRSVGGQVQIVNAALSGLTDDWLRRWESLASRLARHEGHRSALTKTTEELRDVAALAQQSALTLKREVERLIASAGAWGAPAAAPAGGPAPAVTPAPDLDAFKYLGFEDRFRGSHEIIRARLADYVRRFEGQSDVVDLGCGRGEFLDLLREHGITARGVDLNHEMVEFSRTRGLNVAEGDALGFLASLPDGSIGGVFAAQVVEHLDPGYLMRLLETTGHKLRAGGVAIFETINPTCWKAFFDSYLRDLTHVRAIHPETLRYLLRASGFREVEIEFRAPVAEADRLQPAALEAAALAPDLAALVSAFNTDIDKLNATMFGYQDYAAIGRK